ELAHRNAERVVGSPARLEIADERVEDAVEVRDDHLIDLVLEDVRVPRHAVRHHDERRAVLDEVTREERVKTERAGTVTLAVALREPLEVEEVRALHEPAHALENRVLRPRRAARSLVRVLERERAPELVARLVIELVDRIEAVDVRDAVIASEAHGRELRAEPTGPVAGLEGLELVSFGA